MSEMSRREFVGHMHAYADSIEQDMARVRAMLEDGSLTEGEAEGILTRVAWMPFPSWTDPGPQGGL